MRLVTRWGVAVAISGAAFGLSWWGCQNTLRLDESAALGLAGAVLAVVLAVAGWWAARPAGSGDSGGAGSQVLQEGRAGRDVNIAGRDQTIINYWRRDE
jgi:hypothetical protein